MNGQTEVVRMQAEIDRLEAELAEAKQFQPIGEACLTNRDALRKALGLKIGDNLHEHVMTLKAAGNITLSGCDLKLRDLIGGVVRNVQGPSKYRSKYGTARWVLVRDAFAVGSGVANALCREFGFDPDEALRS